LRHGTLLAEAIRQMWKDIVRELADTVAIANETIRALER
jgi:hypothetical protein